MVNLYKRFFLFLLVNSMAFLLFQCQEKPKKVPVADIVTRPAKMEEHVSDDLKSILEAALQNKGQLNDTIRLAYANLADSFYAARNFEPVWSDHSRFLSVEDSLFSFISHSKEYGLFPTDYHFRALSFIHRVINADSIARKNAVIWARMDILLTDAFFKLVKDIKRGRLDYDSVTLRADSVLHDSLFLQTLSGSLQAGSVAAQFHALEPIHPGYDSIRAYLGNFLTIAHFKPYTYLVYPYQDSLLFYASLKKRLRETGIPFADSSLADTTTLAAAIRKYQQSQGLKTTGKVSDQMVGKLNNTDWERFKRIAINLDRYKLLPDSLPHHYVWVNLPSFPMQVYDNDTLVFESRVIVGAPKTRTPLLTSEISNFITFPQWTVPYSIIFKEMLPKIQKNIEFLNKENLMVVDANDNVIDPKLVNWAKLSKNHFPYLLKQRQGDDNSLGVIKFNFRNKYSVYLHDTNVRSKFAQSFRAISHGCVRVKEWEKMARFLVRNDTLRYSPDTLKAWISRQEKHVVTNFPRMPVFIRYFTVEGKDEKIKFFDDIYGEDRILQERYFANKQID